MELSVEGINIGSSELREFTFGSQVEHRANAERAQGREIGRRCPLQRRRTEDPAGSDEPPVDRADAAGAGDVSEIEDSFEDRCRAHVCESTERT